MFCIAPYTQRYEWQIGFRHGMRNCMLYAVMKAVSRSSTIRLRCIVKRAGDVLKPEDSTTIRLSNQTIDGTIGLKTTPNPNWPASQLPSSSVDCGVRTAMMDSQDHKKAKEKPFVSYADNKHRNKTAEPSTYGHHRWYRSEINELESAEHNKSKQ
jgi:hypothetical protein